MWTFRIASRPSLVWRLDGDAAIEAARAQQRLVEHVRAVGRGQHDHALARRKAVHLGQDLVQRLLAFVVAAEGAAAASAADGVQLVDEDDGWRRLAGLLEQVAHAAGADADDHLDELARAHAEERHVGFAGHGAREQRLARARRADEQHAFGRRAAQAGVLGRVLEEIDDLFELFLGLVDAGDVGERDARQAVSAWS